MKRLYWLLFATLVFVAQPVACLAQTQAITQCPWMNAATAGGFLGGEVQSALSGVTVDGDATCEFTREKSTLRIAIHTMLNVSQEYPGYLAQCGASAIALKGIGNQAVQCVPSSGASKGEELIVGRVRDRAFVITIKAKWVVDPPSTPTKTRNPISDDSENIAEQVAGAMF